MELTGERLIAAPLATTWAALNDPQILKDCIAGCESLERTGDDAFAAVVAMKIGPVSARFKGNLKMTNVNPPSGYTIHFDGQGGVAGFGRGSADVSLSAQGDAATKLAYQARATVGGKMAQIGSRLIDATAAKITDDFFKAFEARVRTEAPAAMQALDAGQAGAVPVAAPAVRRHEPAGNLGWALAAIVIAVTLYFVLR